MVIKIKKKVLKDFLTKFKMNGSGKIDEAIFDFAEDGLKSTTNNATQQIRVSAWLKTAAFDSYEAIGKLGMNDLDTVVTVLDRFGEVLTLSKEGNLLTVSGDSKKVAIELVAEEFLKTDITEPDLEFDNTIAITATKLNEVVKDCGINKESILTIETGDKTVTFRNTGKYKFETKVGAPQCKEGSKVNFREPFFDAITKLDGNLEISIKSQYPAKIRESTETTVLTFIVAPRMDE